MLQLIVMMITDQGQYLTLSLRQEIRTECIDPVEMTKQRIMVLKMLMRIQKIVMKKIFPALIPIQTAEEKRANLIITVL